MEASVEEAARTLGISPRRVRALAAAGQLHSRRVGRAWVIDLDGSNPARTPGRRLSARSAWGALGLLEDRLSRSERQRARQRRRQLAELPPGALLRRADVHRFLAHRAAVPRLGRDPRLVLSGVSAAGQHGVDLIALDQVEAYLRPEHLDSVRREYALRPPASDAPANVILRVPRPTWPFSDDERVAPALVVAADLLDARDERSVRAARALIE
jgi:excisionase family DNA binding protein